VVARKVQPIVRQDLLLLLLLLLLLPLLPLLRLPGLRLLVPF